jgi:chemotaxis protein methyltransferase CheR
MTTTLPDPLLSQVSGQIAALMGLNFPPERWRDLERGLSQAAPELGLADARACGEAVVAGVLSDPQLEILASYLTIGETYFFRETHTFDLLQHTLLPELIAQRQTERRLRIWSAGCCTGEEPYSIAILLRQLLPDPADWNLTLLATDLNRRFLERAAAGVYSEWSFRRAPAGLKTRYFNRTPEGRYALAEPIRKLVNFAYLNLALDAYPSLSTNTNAMDVIICRNVLMYFDQEHTRRAVQGFHRALVEGGWLIVSPSEASHVLFSQFEAVTYPDVILYRKRSGRGREAPSLATVTPTAWVPAATPTTPDWVTQSPIAPLVVETVAPTTLETAQTLYGQGRYVEAEAAAKTVVVENPQHSEALGLLTRLCANLGRLDDALIWCRRAVTADRLNPAWCYLEATIQLERGETAQAALALKRALYLAPGFVLAHYALGNLARRQGQTEAASRHFANTLELLSNYPREAVLPESDGLTAGRLGEILRATHSLVPVLP